MSRVDSVGMAKQAAFGTKQTTMEYFVPVESADPNLNRETMEVEETVGHRFPTDIDYGTEFWEASMSGKARLSSLPRMLSGFMGAPTTSATAEATAKQHLFNPVAASSIVPHSILFNRSDPSTAITDLLWDAYGNSLSLGVAVNEFLNFEATYVGKSNDDARPEPTVTLDTSPRVNFDEVTAFISVNGAAEVAAPLSSFSLNYSNNFETDNFVLGARTLYALNEGNASADVSFTVKDTLSTHYRRALLADPANVKIRLLGTGALIGTGISYVFEVTVYRCHYLTAPAAISAAERLTGIEVSARAAYDTTASKFVDVRVINTVASY